MSFKRIQRAWSAFEAVTYVFSIVRASLLVATLLLPSIAAGQDQQSSSTSSADFLTLRDRRHELEKQIPASRSEMEILQQQLRDRDSLEKGIQTSEQGILRFRSDKGLSETYRRAADAQKLQLAQLPSREDIQSALEKKAKELGDAQKRLEDTELQISRLIDIERPKQEFKKWMSGAFALLVGMVIIGFFVIAGRDESVRRQIFSGQTGIQFVTLFSLVIAIILFGITDILHDRELAALLGGLSGFILGRGVSNEQQK